MARSRTLALAALLTLASLAAAGCLQGDAQESTELPRARPAPEPSIGGAEHFRHLAAGQDSSMPVDDRMVIDDPYVWEMYWRAHKRHSDDPNATAPEVDFTRERAVIATLGPLEEGCWHVRWTGYRVDGNVTIAEATVYAPGDGAACEARTVSPYHFATIPTTEGRVEFTQRVVYGGTPDEAERQAAARPP